MTQEQFEKEVRDRFGGGKYSLYAIDFPKSEEGFFAYGLYMVRKRMWKGLSIRSDLPDDEIIARLDLDFAVMDRVFGIGEGDKRGCSGS